MRFILTAGQKGDVPQADALIEELPAEVIMADTAYDSDKLRKIVAENDVHPAFVQRELDFPGLSLRSGCVPMSRS